MQQDGGVVEHVLGYSRYCCSVLGIGSSWILLKRFGPKHSLSFQRQSCLSGGVWAVEHKKRKWECAGTSGHNFHGSTVTYSQAWVVAGAAGWGRVSYSVRLCKLLNLNSGMGHSAWSLKVSMGISDCTGKKWTHNLEWFADTVLILSETCFLVCDGVGTLRSQQNTPTNI